MLLRETASRRNVVARTLTATPAAIISLLLLLVASCLCPGAFANRSLKARQQLQQTALNASSTKSLQRDPSQMPTLSAMVIPSSPTKANATQAVTGTLTTYSIIYAPASASGQMQGGTRYILDTDDGRRLSVDLSGVPGMGSGPGAAVNCTQFVVTRNTTARNSSGGTSNGTSCASGANATLRGLMRKQGGVRITLHLSQETTVVRPGAAVAAVSSSSVFAAQPLPAVGLDLLAQPNSTQGHRQLTAVRRSISLLVALVTACGQSSGVSVSDLTNEVLPIYRQWFASASYGRASLDPRSTVIAVNVACSVATTCYRAEDNVAAAVKQATNFASLFTNVIVVMPPAWESACKPTYIGLGEAPGDTTWVRRHDWALDYPTIGLHELLHNFNLAHANGNTGVEYGDSSCILSAYSPADRKVFYPNGAHQWQLGWSDLVADLDMTQMKAGSTRTLWLPASSSKSTAANLLRVRTASTSYYINFRVRAELDMLPPEFDRQVLVQRLVGDQNTANPTNFVTSLSSGQTVTMDGFTLAFTLVDGTGASVTVSSEVRVQSPESRVQSPESGSGGGGGAGAGAGGGGSGGGGGDHAEPRCGPGFGSCANGACCSRDGYCNVGDAWCGAGCQGQYGDCQQTVHIKAATAANKCIDIPGNAQNSGQVLQQWDCNGAPEQTFTLVPIGRSWYNIKTSSGLCVSVNAGGGQGSFMLLRDCNKADDQAYGFFDVSGYTFSLRPRHNLSVCANINGGSSQNGAKVQVWECNQSDAQTFSPIY